MHVPIIPLIQKNITIKLGIQVTQYSHRLVISFYNTHTGIFN